MTSAPNEWPSLPLEAWEDTFATLHRWTQIVGKVRLAQAPWMHHSWHATLYVTPRGLTTSPIPHGTRTFQVTFDFIAHQLLIEASDGGVAALPLGPRPVAEFHREFLDRLDTLGLSVKIHGSPNEVEDATPFATDWSHKAYDAESATRFWRILLQTDRVLQHFRARFVGKSSPVHFFWGSFDLAVTRFSGRTAPAHPGGVPHLPDWVAREAYSHEVSSLGFWPGGGPHRFPLFYSYAYPEPEGYASATVEPADAFYSTDLREWVLPYAAVREAASPDEALLAFAESTYDAAARLGRWDRVALERVTDPRSPDLTRG
jgi:hypothetical protein